LSSKMADYSTFAAPRSELATCTESRC
jgi:hypothetical protein